MKRKKKCRRIRFLIKDYPEIKLVLDQKPG